MRQIAGKPVNDVEDFLNMFYPQTPDARRAGPASPRRLGAYSMARRLPNAKIILYSDAGHGFLFQHPDDFGQEVLNFLR